MSVKMYKTSPADLEKIGKAFVVHPTDADQGERLELLRQQLSVITASLAMLCPPGRELSLAITKIEEAAHWAQCAILYHPRA